jgi:hypothetical protein
MQTLESIQHRLREKLPVPAVFTSVNTRLIIQVGVNLKKICPDHNCDARRIALVLAALRRMGIHLEES